VWGRGNVPVLIDPHCYVLEELTPSVLIDAILAKRNCGITKNMADLTIGLGPGFVAGEDVDVVIETSRGHNLGRVITFGPASSNTGIPGMVAGVSKKRVIHAPCTGTLSIVKDVGTQVEQGEPIAHVDGTLVPATISGLVRGMIRDQFQVTKGLKIADIDPRMEEYDNCFTISDKARCISGGVLEAILTSRIAEA
jgi:xanthine dehydrogenase accessory factor